MLLNYSDVFVGSFLVSSVQHTRAKTMLTSTLAAEDLGLAINFRMDVLVSLLKSMRSIITQLFADHRKS